MPLATRTGLLMAADDLQPAPPPLVWPPVPTTSSPPHRSSNFGASTVPLPDPAQIPTVSVFGRRWKRYSLIATAGIVVVVAALIYVNVTNPQTRAARAIASSYAAARHAGPFSYTSTYVDSSPGTAHSSRSLKTRGVAGRSSGVQVQTFTGLGPV